MTAPGGHCDGRPPPDRGNGAPTDLADAASARRSAPAPPSGTRPHCGSRRHSCATAPPGAATAPRDCSSAPPPRSPRSATRPPTAPTRCGRRSRLAPPRRGTLPAATAAVHVPPSRRAIKVARSKPPPRNRCHSAKTRAATRCNFFPNIVVTYRAGGFKAVGTAWGGAILRRRHCSC